MTDKLRVVLADDQDLVRAGFRVILGTEPGIEVVGEAADGAAAVRQVQKLTPDIVLMDVQMPGTDGLAATQRILADPTSRTKVIILTTFDRDDYLFAALRSGASGFLLKNASPEDLVTAVRVVAKGEALLSPAVTRRVLAEFTRSQPAEQSNTRPPELTNREYEVLVELARGASNAEIAQRLVLGETTVKTHVSRILSKLGLRDRIHAVVYAYEHGIVTPGQE